jgi:hypothetical protein
MQASSSQLVHAMQVWRPDRFVDAGHRLLVSAAGMDGNKGTGEAAACKGLDGGAWPEKYK